MQKGAVQTAPFLLSASMIAASDCLAALTMDCPVATGGDAAQAAS